MPSSGGVSNAALLDLTRTTLTNLPDMEFETALEYQNYPVCNQWFKEDKVELESGTSIERNIVLDTSGNARHVRLYQKTPINVADTQQKITAPWVQVQTHWSIERREALRNRRPAAYINLLKSRRQDSMLDLANLLEDRAWSTPSSADDDLNPRGLPYYLSMREDDVAQSTDSGGFEAYRVRFTNGTSSASKAGINGSTAANAKWKNYAAVYTNIDAEFVKRMRRAFHATSFVPPMLVRDLTQGPASKFRIYMDLDTLTEYEDLTTQSNENLGADLDPFHNLTTFRRVPIIYTPQLDGFTVLGGGVNQTSNTPAPVFAVNHNYFHPFVQEGDWLREDDPMTDQEQHNVFTTFVDSSYQFFCKNCRAAGFVLHKKITA